MSGDEAPSLFERITLPSIPKEVGRKISQLEQEFVRAEIEQCMLPSIVSLSFRYRFALDI
jgi:hypothetical protein